MKGKGCGYILAGPPQEISVYGVSCAFEPEIAIDECLAGHGICDLNEECRVSGYWKELNNNIVTSIDKKKIIEFI